MSDTPPTVAASPPTPTAKITPISYVWLAATVLRVLHEAPALLDAVEQFWSHVSGTESPPDHVEAAVRAAISSARKADSAEP
jgi:hypothetical protein